ncbi:hypothetical protein DL93DRAFT_2220330 [Clavulina sp. PMI_390]|nr:hypothetical protein DL93DRAFT_2220330 [Clavulina sp. PMI_390]
MNSYPIELLIQHAPLLFVAGLGDNAGSPPPGTPSVNANGNANGLDAATTPTHERRASMNIEGRDPFAVLTSRLRNSFASRRRGAIWDLNKSRHFNVVLVDKTVKFPPRKVIPTSANSQADGPSTHNQSPRSPLSPLNPSSPLYPDGMIAPIWVRKHIELVPCVFLLFMRLWEAPPPASPLEASNPSDRDDERKRDTELAAEIGARKKTTAERGMKLTVVLMASRRMLDDPNLDTRLSFIRRQSGLDARASLYVLSPLSAAELNDFIESLQEALWEPAIEYYSSHSKRVRKKKNRFPQQATPLPPGSGPIIGRPLRNEGWIVRYEYKMATFAEFRLEPELARKHYEDCWEALVEMFSSNSMLPPRTKRWAEARVLADSVSFKICKLHLYQSEFSRTVAHFNRHMRRMSELSFSWGIGEDSFEYWSWAGRQYRLFAELLDYATRAGLELPPITGFAPRPSPGSQLPNHGPSPSLIDANIPFGVNPTASLQHAGYYYFAAARCIQQRHQKYLEATAHEVSSSSPALANERKIDHQAIVLELFSKAYEIFKAQKAPSDRITFHMAYRIAETYFNAGKYDLGVKFFERIARTFRRERWDAMLHPTLSMWCESARQSGDVEGTVPLLLELIGLESTSSEDRTSYEEELVEIIKVSKSVSMFEYSRYLVVTSALPGTASVVFWQNEVFVDEPAAFQLCLTPLPGSLRSLPISSIKIFWDENEPPAILNHSDEASNSEVIPLGVLESSVAPVRSEEASDTGLDASLRWEEGKSKVFAGSIVSHAPRRLELARVLLLVKQREWEIEIPISLSGETLSTAVAKWAGSSSSTAVPITSPEPYLCSVVFRPHQFSFRLEHAQPAFVGERYPIDVVITNLDDNELQLDLDVLMQPAEDESVNEMTMNDTTSTSLIKGISFGRLKPGENARQTLFLLSSGSAGDRVLDFSIQSQAISSEELPEGVENINETLHTLVVKTAAPLKLSVEPVYSRIAKSDPGLFDMRRFDEEFFHPRYKLEMAVEVESCGPWETIIESLQLAVSGVRLAHSSLSSTSGDFPCSFQANDSFSFSIEVEISEAAAEDLDQDSLTFPAQIQVVWRRSSSSAAAIPSATTVLSIPSLHPPREDIIALLSCPPSALLHEAFALTLVIHNRQRSRTADVYLDVDSSEAFVLAGPRHARLTTLLPGTSEEVRYRLMPLLTGVVKLPNFRVVDRRKQLGFAGTELPAEGEGVTGGAPGSAPGGGGPAEPQDIGRPIQVVMVGQDVILLPDSVGSESEGAELSPHTIFVHPY